MNNKVRWAAIVLLAIVTTGCASTSELRDELSAVRSIAEQALAESQRASEQAASAEAQANEAKNCCMQNSEKIDRAFERSMMK